MRRKETKIQGGRKRVLEGFFKYCEDQSVKLLQDDKRFIIQSTLICGDLQEVRSILKSYVQFWKEEMEEEPQRHKKQNAGRRIANTYLREACESKVMRLESA